MIAAAELRHVGHAELREHRPIGVRLDVRRQPQAGGREAERLVLVEEAIAREAEPHVDQVLSAHLIGVVEHDVRAPVVQIDAAFRGAGITGEELRRRVVGTAIGVASEHPAARAEIAIDAHVEVVGLHLRRSARVEVVGARHRIAGLIRLGIVPQHVERDGIHALARNPVPRKRIAHVPRPVRVRPRRQRIVDDDRLAVRAARLAEIARALQRRRHGRRHFAEAVLTQPLVRHHEERAIGLNRTAGHAAELAAIEIRQRHVALLAEVGVRVERRVAVELERRSVQLIRARLVDQVQHAGQAAPVFRAVASRLHLELLHRVDGRKHRHAVEAVHGRKRRADAVDQRLHQAAANAVDRIAHLIVRIADRALHAGREIDQRVDVARVERQRLDARVVHDLADRRRRRIEHGGVGDDADRFVEDANLQRDVDERLLLHLQHDAFLHELLEALERRFQPIAAGRQIRDDVGAASVGRGLAAGVRARIDGDDGDAGQHGAIGIFHGAEERAGGGLRREGRRREDREDVDEEKETEDRERAPAARPLHGAKCSRSRPRSSQTGVTEVSRERDRRLTVSIVARCARGRRSRRSR